MARHNMAIDWDFEKDCEEYYSNRHLYKNISIDANRFKIMYNKKFIGRSSSLSESVSMRDNAERLNNI